VTIKARPNLNGNTRRDFGDAYKALLDAQKAIKAARAAVMENVANGRNYQHLPKGALLSRDLNTIDRAVIEDRRRLHEDFDKALALLGTIGSDIADACGQHDGEVAA
jgi:hypothetical protein